MESLFNNIPEKAGVVSKGINKASIHKGKTTSEQV